MSQLEMSFRQIALRNSYNPASWFKQIKRTVSFDVTARFNPIQQSTAMYNSHRTFNCRNTTINDQRSTNTDSEVFSTILALDSIFTLITCTCTVNLPIVMYVKKVTITKSHVLSPYLA